MARKIPPLSHSAMQDFKTCPRKYAWGKLEKRKGEEDSTPLVIGRLAHEAYEHFQRRFEKEGVLSGCGVPDSMMERVEALSESDFKDLEFLLSRFVRLQPFGEGQFPEIETALALDDRLQPVKVTQKPSGAMNTPSNTLIRGKIDRFYFPSSGVVDGVPTTVHITDWKTGHNEDDGEDQAKLYAWMLWKHYQMLINFKVDFWYARSGNVKSFEFTAMDLRVLDTEIPEFHKTIATTEEFKPTPNPYCTWCPYRVECGAWKSMPVVTPGDKLLAYAQARGYVDGLEGQLKDLLNRSGDQARIVSGPCACEYRSTVYKTVDPMKLIDLIQMAENVPREDAYIMAARYLKVDNSKLPKAWFDDPVLSEVMAGMTTEKTSSRFWFGAAEKVTPRVEKAKEPAKVEVLPPSDPTDSPEVHGSFKRSDLASTVAVQVGWTTESVPTLKPVTPDHSMKQEIAPELVCPMCKNPGLLSDDENEVHCTSCGHVWYLREVTPEVHREAVALNQLTTSPTLPGDYHHGKAIAQAHGCYKADSFGCDFCKPARKHAQVIGWERPWHECPECKTSMPFVDGVPGKPETMDQAVIDQRANQQTTAKKNDQERKSLIAEIASRSKRHGINATERMYVMYATTGMKSARGVPANGDMSLKAAADFLNGCTKEQLEEAVRIGKIMHDEKKGGGDQ